MVPPRLLPATPTDNVAQPVGSGTEILQQLCALRLAADHGAVRGGCVEPDRLDVPESDLL